VGNALETIRRLQKRGSGKPQETRTPAGLARGVALPLPASPGLSKKAATTREDFESRILSAQARIGAVYPEGLVESLNEAEGRLLDEVEERMDKALQAGDLEAAGGALVEWEEAWLVTIRSERGKP